MPKPALTVKCPVCGAGRNRACKGVAGNAPIVSGVHAARNRAAQRNAQKDAQVLREKLSDGTPVNVTVTDSRKGK